MCSRYVIEEWRTVRENNLADTKVREEGGGGKAPSNREDWKKIWSLWFPCWSSYLLCCYRGSYSSAVDLSWKLSIKQNYICNCSLSCSGWNWELLGKHCEISQDKPMTNIKYFLANRHLTLEQTYEHAYKKNDITINIIAKSTALSQSHLLFDAFTLMTPCDSCQSEIIITKIKFQLWLIICVF